VQDEIARTVTRELDVRFGPAAGAAPRLRRTRNVAAYELYRRGSDRSRLRSDSAAWEGMDLLRQAVALDSTYAAAWAELALMSHRVGLTLPPAARERQWEIADAAARRAVALDDSLADGHVMLGKLHMAAFDFAAAERQLTEAVRLDPTLAEPHELMVTLYLWQERPAEALAHAERAVALDPLAAGARAERARALLGVDRCDDALAELDALANLRPPLLRVADIAAHCYARKGMWPAAIAVLRPQAERGLASALAQTAYMLARAGRRDEALRIHAALLGRWRRGEDGAFHVGLVYAGLADLDRAVECFERAVVDRSLHAGHASPGHLWLVLPGPLADDLRRHPGFRRLRARLGRPVRWRGRWQP
jgi:serine/threonine-protein kinase